MSDIKLSPLKNLPCWLRSISSDYLHDKHRAPTSSYYLCLKSLFSLHTETINICILFVILFVKISISELGLSDKTVIGLFLGGAFLCHMFSTAFHTFLCHSEKVSRTFQKLDYCGIAILITASFIPWLHYGFYYEEAYYTHSYMAGVISMAALAIWLSINDKYGGEDHSASRALGFAIFGLFGVVPCIHWLFLHSEVFWASINLRFALVSLVSMGLLYLIGASFYASRVPERFFPGKFDLFLHSHQIFHVLVTIAALVHYYGLSFLLDHVRSANYKFDKMVE